MINHYLQYFKVSYLDYCFTNITLKCWCAWNGRKWLGRQSTVLENIVWNHQLVGGLEHDFYFPQYLGWWSNLTFIFFRGVGKTPTSLKFVGILVLSLILTIDKCHWISIPFFTRSTGAPWRSNEDHWRPWIKKTVSETLKKTFPTSNCGEFCGDFFSPSWKPTTGWVWDPRWPCGDRKRLRWRLPRRFVYIFFLTSRGGAFALYVRMLGESWWFWWYPHG